MTTEHSPLDSKGATLVLQQSVAVSWAAVCPMEGMIHLLPPRAGTHSKGPHSSGLGTLTPMNTTSSCHWG